MPGRVSVALVMTENHCVFSGVVGEEGDYGPTRDAEELMGAPGTDQPGCVGNMWARAIFICNIYMQCVCALFMCDIYILFMCDIYVIYVQCLCAIYYTMCAIFMHDIYVYNIYRRTYD